MKKSLKTVIFPVVAALLAGSAVAYAENEPVVPGPEGDQAAAGPPPRSLYEKIYAHYAHLGRDVREEFRDGPCKIERHWERDGDYKETIRCRGPRN
jgi:hypothetical protein